MKYFLNFLLILSLAVSFSACESDSNGRMPNDLADANTGLIQVQASSDVLIDKNNLADFNFDIGIDVLWDDIPYNRVDLVIVYNGDFENQYTLESYTALPAERTITIADIVALIDEINTEADISEGDVFDIFTSIELSDGTYIPGYLYNGKPTNAPSVRNIITILKGGVNAFTVPVPCPFVETDYAGTMDVYEKWNDGSGDATYTAEVTINSDLSDENTVVYDIVGLFTGDDACFFQVQVDRKTYTLTQYIDPSRPADEANLVVDADLFGWGLGRLWFDDFKDAMLVTCQQYMIFTVTPGLNDTGLWWGQDAVTYYIGPGALDAGSAKKSTDGSGPKNPEFLKAMLMTR